MSELFEKQPYGEDDYVEPADDPMADFVSQLNCAPSRQQETQGRKDDTRSVIAPLKDGATNPGTSGDGPVLVGQADTSQPQPRRPLPSNLSQPAPGIMERPAQGAPAEISQPAPSGTGDRPARPSPADNTAQPGSDKNPGAGARFSDGRPLTPNEIGQELEKLHKTLLVDELSDKLTGLIGTNGELTDAEKEKVYNAFQKAHQQGCESELAAALNKKLGESGSSMRIAYDQRGFLGERSLWVADHGGRVISSMQMNLDAVINNLSSVYPPPRPWR